MSRIADTCRYGPPDAARKTTKPWSAVGSNGGVQLTSRPQPAPAGGVGGSTEGVIGRSLVYVNVLLDGMSARWEPSLSLPSQSSAETRYQYTWCGSAVASR